MKIVNIRQAKSSFSKLIARAAMGKQIIIAKAGKPVAKLTTFSFDVKPRTPGVWKGRVTMGPTFGRLPMSLFR